MNKKPKILFISHDASLTGAPILLYNLMMIVKEQGLYEMQLIIKRGGDLESRYNTICPVLVLKDRHYSASTGLKKGILKIRYLINCFRILTDIRRPDVVFSNTLTNGKLIRSLRFYRAPVLSYVHELETVIREFWKSGESAFALRFTHTFLCPSKAVAANLRIKHGINDAQLLRYYFPKPKESDLHVNRKQIRGAFASKFGLSPADFWVAGMGTVTYRKGVDYFARICSLVATTDPGVRFVWMGAFEDEALKLELDAIVASQRLESRLILTGKVSYDQSTLSAFDLLLMTSREDPYPLVVVEAALNKVPTLSFAGNGGASEFISDGCGWEVTDFSEEAMAEAIKGIRSDEPKRTAAAEKAHLRAVDWHSNKGRILNGFNTALTYTKNKIVTHDH